MTSPSSPVVWGKQDCPTICCLCPTYGRPGNLMNAVMCFLSQDYPADRCKLVILDDLGNITPHESSRWSIHSQTNRFNSLPEKYNALWRMAPAADIYVVWEDDDIQFPWCLKSHANACAHREWSYPSIVLSDYGLLLHAEASGGRFHGSIAMRSRLLERVGGWPLTKRADFDQQMIARLRDAAPAGDPVLYSPISTHAWKYQLDGSEWQTNRVPPYLFRWFTATAHGQSTMKSPDDESWYDRYEPSDRTGPHTIVPAFDSPAITIFSQLGQLCPSIRTAYASFFRS